jgi:type IV pilus assembly protein PilQ
MTQFGNSLHHFFRPALFFALALVSQASICADPVQNKIEALEVSKQQAGSLVMKVTLASPPASAPASFSVANPPRLAFDFANTVNATGKSTHEVGDANLRSINIAQGNERARVVLNLATPVVYESRIDGRNLFVTLQSASGGGAQPSSATQFAVAPPGAAQHSVRDIDFRRGKSGEGRVIIDLSDSTVGIDVRQHGKNIVIDLIKTALPKNLERRLDVTDFATPVHQVDAVAQGENVRVTIEPKGLWEHSAYQTDTRFVVEVKPIREDPNKLIQGEKRGYTGEKLSLNFQNVEVRSVLQVIADFTGFNIITSDTVTGNVTLRLKDVPWDQAFDIILQAKGLDYRKTGNVIWVAPRDELATREKLALEAKQQIAELEPTRTESFQLNYHKAEAFQKILSDEKQKILSKRGSAVIDARTNTLFIQDVPSKLEEVRKLVATIDVPVRQVMIEARIVEASDTFSKNLGARLGVTDLRALRGDTPGISTGLGNVRVLPGGNLRSVGVQTTQTPDFPESFIPDSLSVNLPAAAIAGSNPGLFTLSLFSSALTKFLNLEISALQADGKGKIISSPRVVTADQMEATIEQGTEIPYEQATSSGATSITFKKAVLSLKVKPQITPDDNIIMNLAVNKDSPDFTAPTAATFGPPINTKQVNTQVLVENGGTVVIGGIYTQNQTTSVNKVPLLGDMPVFGALFRNKLQVDDKTELLIFISPKLIHDHLAGN